MPFLNQAQEGKPKSYWIHEDIKVIGFQQYADTKQLAEAMNNKKSIHNKKHSTERLKTD